MDNGSSRAPFGFSLQFAIRISGHIMRKRELFTGRKQIPSLARVFHYIEGQLLRTTDGNALC